MNIKSKILALAATCLLGGNAWGGPTLGDVSPEPRGPGIIVPVFVEWECIIDDQSYGIVLTRPDCYFIHNQIFAHLGAAHTQIIDIDDETNVDHSECVIYIQPLLNLE